MTKVYDIKDLFGILVTVNVNVINHMAQESICSMKIVSAKKKKKDDELVEECSENIDEKEMIYNVTLIDYKNVSRSCTIYTVLFVIVLLVIIGISNGFIYFYWYSKKIILNNNLLSI